MFGTSDKELAEARHLAQEIAERLTRLQEIGTVGVNASRIVTIAGTISYSRTTRAWTLGNGRA